MGILSVGGKLLALVGLMGMGVCVVRIGQVALRVRPSCPWDLWLFPNLQTPEFRRWERVAVRWCLVWVAGAVVSFVSSLLALA